MKMPMSTCGLSSSSRKSDGVGGHGLDERGDDRQRGQSGGADREALADRRGGIAELVQRVGDGAGLLAETAHLRDASGVVRHRAVGVDGHRDSDRREHADRGHTDAVETGELAVETAMIAQMVSMGIATERMPTERPVMMTVAGPVSPARAISRTGRLEVKYSVTSPITMPPTAPAITAHQTRQSTPIISVMT